MKAWVVKQHGGPKAVQLEELELKRAHNRQVKVKVEAVGLNHLDLWVRNGVEGHAFPLPMILGCDVSGEIAEETGLDGFPKGTKVVINPILKGEDLVDSVTGKKHPFGLIGETRDGGLAEWIAVSPENLVNRSGLDAQTAAALPIAYITAYQMITRKAQLKKNEWILIQAGGSGVGVACIQFAKSIGARIITTVGSEEKVKKAKALGVDYCIQYTTQDFRSEFQQIKKKEGIRGVNVAIDHVGKSTLESSLRALDWGGRLVTCGATSGSQVTLDLKPIFFKSLSILGSTMGEFDDLNEIVSLVKQKKLTPVIDSTYDFKDVPQALNRLEGRDVFGKIVIQVAT